MPDFKGPEGNKFNVIIELETIEDYNNNMIYSFFHTILQTYTNYEIENNQGEKLGEIQLTKLRVGPVTFRG